VRSSNFDDPISEICRRAPRVVHIVTHSGACHKIVEDVNGTSDAELCIITGQTDCLFITLRCEKAETAAELLSPANVGRLKAALKIYFEELLPRESRGGLDVVRLSGSSDDDDEGHNLCLVFLVTKLYTFDEICEQFSACDVCIYFFIIYGDF
jgi:hypothetical protein